MFCRNCGKEVNPQAIACLACGVPPRAEKNFCHNCGTATQANQAMCIKCGVALAGGGTGANSGEKSKIVAGILGLLCGGIGAHKFYLGYQKEAIMMLATCLVSLVLCTVIIGFLPLSVVCIIGWAEGIIYITKSDEEFARIYVQGHKGWF